MNKIRNILMLSCERVAQLIEKQLHGPLGPLERLQLGMHVKMCKACAEYESQQELIDHVLKSDALKQHEDQECTQLKQRVLEELNTEGGTGL